MFGIIDTKVFDGDPLGHIARVAEIMLAGIGTTNQTGIYGLTSSRYENAVTDKDLSLPSTAIIGAQMFNLALNFTRSTNVQFSTETAILQNPY